MMDPDEDGTVAASAGTEISPILSMMDIAPTGRNIIIFVAAGRKKNNDHCSSLPATVGITVYDRQEDSWIGSWNVASSASEEKTMLELPGSLSES